MRNYFEFLMEQLLACSKNYNQTREPVGEDIEEKQVKLEFRKILDKLVINIIEANFENIYFSGGKIGLQIELSLENLQRIVPIITADITVQ